MFTKKNMDEIKAMTEEEYTAYESDLRAYTADRITAMLDAGTTNFVNDHNDRTEKLDAVVYLSDGHVCPVSIGTVCCLNRLYIGDDDQIHLSRSSVAGNFGEFQCNKYPTPVEFVDAYVNKYNAHVKDLKDRLDITLTSIINYKTLRLSLEDRLEAEYR